jgi:hypothetical protein
MMLMALGVATPAQATVSVYYMDVGQFNNAINANQMVDRVRTSIRAAGVEPPPLAEGQQRKPRQGSKPAPTKLAFKPSPKVNMPRKLAATYPPARQREVEAAFVEMLSKFNQLERQFGQPQNDLATAFGAVIAGSHMGYSGKAFPDEYFVPLIGQMRVALQNSEAVHLATDAQKQETYQLLAIIGMTFAVAQIDQSARPNAKIRREIQAAGGQLLQGLLKVPPESVAFGPSGLILR